MWSTLFNLILGKSPNTGLLNPTTSFARLMLSSKALSLGLFSLSSTPEEIITGWTTSPLSANFFPVAPKPSISSSG